MVAQRSPKPKAGVRFLPGVPTKERENMFILTMAVMGGLFFNDNSEFFAQADANYAAGLTWQHIEGGCRAPDPNELYISAKNEDTGKEWVCFKMSK